MEKVVERPRLLLTHVLVDRVTYELMDRDMVELLTAQRQQLEHWEAHQLVGMRPRAAGSDQRVERVQTRRDSWWDALALRPVGRTVGHLVRLAPRLLLVALAP